VVLRAALRGELVDIVQRPTARRCERGTDDG